jgi:regulator of protease activity HflC (stomatin/prohibitin superfamily)
MSRYESNANHGPNWFLIGSLTATGLLLFAIGIGWYFGASERVQAGYGCAVTHHGRYDETVGPGRYFEPAWGTDFVCFETRPQNVEVGEHPEAQDYNRDTVQTQSRDGRDIGIAAKFRYAVPLESIEPIYTTGARSSDQVWSRLVSSEVEYAIQEVINVTDINTVYGEGRSQVSQQIESNLRTRLEAYGLTLETFGITRVGVPQDYKDAVALQQQQQEDTELEKQKAQTIAAQNDNAVLAAQGQADAALIAAQSEADQNMIVSESITDEILYMQYLDTLSTVQWAILEPGTVQPTMPISTPEPEDRG